MDTAYQLGKTQYYLTRAANALSHIKEENNLERAKMFAEIVLADILEFYAEIEAEAKEAKERKNAV